MSICSAATRRSASVSRSSGKPISSGATRSATASLLGSRRGVGLARIEAGGEEDGDRLGDMVARRRLGGGEAVIEPEPLPFVAAHLVEGQDLDPLDHAERRAERSEVGNLLGK